MVKNDNFKQILYNFYEKHEQRGRKYIRDHFIELGVTERTLDRWLTILESNQTLARKEGSGRPIQIATKENLQKLKYTFDHRSRSQRKFASKIGFSQKYVSDLLKKNTDIRTYKKHKKPDMTQRQKKQVRPIILYSIE